MVIDMPIVPFAATGLPAKCLHVIICSDAYRNTNISAACMFSFFPRRPQAKQLP